MLVVLIIMIISDMSSFVNEILEILTQTEIQKSVDKDFYLV